MKLIDSNASATPEPVDLLPGKSNYLIGNHPDKWRTAVSNYSKVRFRSVYRGIDLAYYGDQRNLEYDFEVAPGANPGTIKFSFEGSRETQIDKNGDLVLTTSDGGEVRHRRPKAYQERNGKRRMIDACYVINRRGVIGFKVARYDRSKALVIDPVLVYSTLLGGTSDDQGAAIAVDNAGNAYIIGNTGSSDFPTKNPLQSTQRSIFVTKLNSAGTALVYSTYIGGLFDNRAGDIAIDSNGNACITGSTRASDFPTVNALQLHNAGDLDAFVCKLNSTGSGLIYSTYLGGLKADTGVSIALDPAGNAYVTGETLSLNFPTANALQSTRSAGGADAFVTKINSTGSAFVYSTYFGGSLRDAGTGIAADSAGNAYVVGSTSSSDLSTVNPLEPTLNVTNLLRTTDGGGSWNPANNGLPANAPITTVTIDSQTTSTLYAGASPYGIFKSTDSGGSWNAINTGLLLPDGVTEIAVDPTDSSKVYAALSSFGVFKSTNGGNTWTRTFFQSADALAIDPITPSTIYEGSVFGLFKSTDGGSNWLPRNPFNSPGIAALAIDPANTSTIYAGTQFNTIDKSTDGGGSWAGLPGPFLGPVDEIAIDPMTTSTIYAASESLWKSTNGGVNWLAIDNGLGRIGAEIVRCIGIDPVTPSTLYVGTDRGLFKSTDGGSNWNITNPGLDPAINDLAIDPKSPSKIYVGANSSQDAFVAKVNPAGTALVYSTYLGGEGVDAATGISVDSGGNAYVAGLTTSESFLTVSPLRPQAGDYDAFVAKLAANGMSLTFVTAVGGGDFDMATDLAADGIGSVWITGWTVSSDFPTTPDAIQVNAGACPNQVCTHAFVTKLNSSTGALLYSTFLGGNGLGSGIVVDASGNMYVTGYTLTSDFPTTAGAFDTSFAGFSDAFITKFSSDTPFDFCLQDESNGNLLKINSSNGNYEFTNCQGLTLGGSGSLTRRGCLITMQVNASDRRVVAKWDSCTKTGTASLQLLSQGTMFTILDRNTSNNSCVCLK